MSELKNFSAFCQAALMRRGGFALVRESASKARALRRRFYYLRTQLPEDERLQAELLEVKVIGRYVCIRRKPPAPDWAQLGDTTSDRPTEVSTGSEIPGCDRLNDAGDLR